LDIRVGFILIEYVGLKWSPTFYSPASPVYLGGCLLVPLVTKVIVD